MYNHSVCNSFNFYFAASVIGYRSILVHSEDARTEYSLFFNAYIEHMLVLGPVAAAIGHHALFKLGLV